MQTVKNQIRRRVLLRLIWVFTVCQCPIYGALGITSLRIVWFAFSLINYIKIPVLNANSKNPGQTPFCAASGLGLHCLPMSILRDSRHKWVKLLMLRTLTIFSLCGGEYTSPHTMALSFEDLHHCISGLIPKQ